MLGVIHPWIHRHLSVKIEGLLPRTGRGRPREDADLRIFLVLPYDKACRDRPWADCEAVSYYTHIRIVGL